MLTDSLHDPFLICDQLTNRNLTVSAWLSGEANNGLLTDDPQIKRYMEVIEKGGSKEEAERAYWGNKIETDKTGNI